MVIPVLVHGKGIYDSDAMKMKYTGMVLEGSRIKEMGRFEELSQAYPDVRVMDFSDSYILPGLVNTHVHLEFTPCRDTYGIYRREDRKARLARAAEHARTLLRSGVTTVRDAGSSMDLVGALSGREAGSEPGTELPRIQAAGMPLTPDGGHLAFLGKTSNSTEELIQAVKERKSAGCGCVKLIVSGGQLTPGSVPEHDTYSRGEIRAAVEAAHELGLPTAAHCLTTSLLCILNVYYTTEFSDDSKTLWLTCLKKLLNSRKTLCDIAAGNTTGMECTHGQLCTRLTDRLGCNNTNCFTNLYRLSGCHVCTVALSTHTNVGLTA